MADPYFATAYSFGMNQGLELADAFSYLGDFSDDYTVVLDFQIDRNDGYRKLLDFKDGTTHIGLYSYFGQLRFYNGLGFGVSNALPANASLQLTLTRDGASDVVKAYLGTTLQFAFTDTANDAVFSMAGNIARLLEDDDLSGRNEASGGLSRRILIYKGALLASEIPPAAALTPGATPEPAALTMWGMMAICGKLVAARYRNTGVRP